MAYDEVYRRGISIFESDCIIFKDEAATDLRTRAVTLVQRQEWKQTCTNCPAKAGFRGLSIVGKFASGQRAGRREPSEPNAAHPPRKYCDLFLVLFLVLYIGLQRRKVAIDGLHKILEGKKR